MWAMIRSMRPIRVGMVKFPAEEVKEAVAQPFVGAAQAVMDTADGVASAVPEALNALLGTDLPVQEAPTVGPTSNTPTGEGHASRWLLYSYSS